MLQLLILINFLQPERSVAVISSNILSKFLYYVLISAMFKTQILLMRKGQPKKGIYLSKLINLKLPLPPLAEQNRIVIKLDNLFILELTFKR